MLWYSMVWYCADMVQLALLTTSCPNERIVPARLVSVALYASIDTTRSGTYLKAPGISMIGQRNAMDPSAVVSKIDDYTDHRSL